MEDFTAVDLRVGTVVEASEAPGGGAHVLVIDFGGLGRRTSSAQITERYTPEALVGRQVVAVLNGRGSGEVLVLAAVSATEGAVLLTPEARVADGTRVV